ncbi:MAG: hypothetical protein J5643_02070 [Lachnospiraceae bacterium]|nr:hypothetical protein [Lachnospiraceae bacterium]
MKGKAGKNLKNKFGRKQKIATAIAGICVAVIAAWIVLMVSIFREEKPGKGKPEAGKKASAETDRGPWFLTEEFRTDSAGRESLVFRCEYDEKGRLLYVIYSDAKKGTYEYSYYYDEGIPITRVTQTADEEIITKEFLPDGRIRFQVKNESCDTYFHVEATQYDEQERPLSLTVQHESASTPYTETVTLYSYDAYGHVVLEEKRENVGGTAGESVIVKNNECNAEGCVIRSYDSPQDGGKKELTLYVTYFNEGREEKIYAKGGYSADHTGVREYDKDGRIIKEEYSQGSFVKSRISYEYEETERGILVTKSVYQAYENDPKNGETTISECEYDKDGRIISEKKTVFGVLEYSYAPEFDENGRVVKVSEIYLGITPVETEYLYDDNGNLTERKNDREKYTYTYVKIDVPKAQAAENAEFYAYFPEDLPGIFYWK